MKKMIALLLLILASVISAAGYLYLSEKIIAGEKQIAAGQLKLEKGQLRLSDGKIELEAGKQALQAGKQKYNDAADNVLIVLADNVLNKGQGLKKGREQIADGKVQIAEGEITVDAGKTRIDAGELKLQRGMEQLHLAKNIRIACAIGAFLFALLTILLGFYWRSSLRKIFNH